ncbi:MAG: hypothetical protein MJE77_13930 [Proteobacteria bacterium]|nr:hypothetical protein [Pseudomonadota bacterium]
MKEHSTHDLEAERALCGAPFVRRDVIGELEVDAEDFYHPAHQYVWRALCDCFAAAEPVDAVTVGNRLRAAGKLEPIGGLQYLSRLALSTPTADNAPHYAAIVKQHALTRRLAGGLSEALAAVHEGKGGDASYDKAQQALREYETKQPGTAIPIGRVVLERVKELSEIAERRAKGESVLTGIPTGIEKLDELLGGLQPGIVTALGGRPAMGKSALALGIADWATEHGHGVHVFSLEDPRRNYAERVLGRSSRVPIQDIRACNLTQGQWHELRPAISRIAARPRWLYEDRPGLSVQDIIRSARKHRRENRTELVIVDYLQLIRWPKHATNLHQAIQHNVYCLADAAMADELAYLAVAQLNRNVEHRDDKRPRASDFRESGSIEERCKCVLGIHRGSKYGDPEEGIDYPRDGRKPSPEEWEHQVDILVLKNNQGETGYVRARWDGPTTRVY